MEESVADTLLKAADVMHWFGQHQVGNTMILCSRLLRTRGLHRLDQLASYVEAAEALEPLPSERTPGDPK